MVSPNGERPQFSIAVRVPVEPVHVTAAPLMIGAGERSGVNAYCVIGEAAPLAAMSCPGVGVTL